MSLDEKLSRLRKIYKIAYPSDQEIHEAEKLEEEIKLILEESDIKIRPREPEPEQPKKIRGNLLRKILFVKPKEPPKPVTEAELADLTMIARKEELKARIAKAKAKQKESGGSQSVFETIQKVIGKSTSNPFDMSGGSRRRSDDNLFR